MRRLPVCLLGIFIVSFASLVIAEGELPPHAPGTICITPKGWCFVDQGTVGTPCGCGTPDGYIEGTHG
ncbi:hypothetical protein [Yoonia sp. R2-816]|uniref:hypothetical protein n=1 Tax=Yoonia sp. R2-816 TaxID=3342638 RepID=UPI00372B39D4